VNIYVGNLPFDATDSDLRALSTDYGTVDSASVIMDRENGRSRGFGFVELAARKWPPKRSVISTATTGGAECSR
jgi:RNA recognition motif-containing protein